MHANRLTRTMGTYANVTLVVADSAAGAPAARVAHRTFQRVDSLMSNWTATSEVARINSHAREVRRDARRVAEERVDIAVLLVQPNESGVDSVWVESNLRDFFRTESGTATHLHVEFF